MVMSDAEFDAWFMDSGVGATALEAERILEMGDITHIIVKPDGAVSVNRGCSPVDERLGVQLDTVRDAVNKAARCKQGRTHGPEVRQLAGKDTLPPVCEDNRPYRWQM